MTRRPPLRRLPRPAPSRLFALPASGCQSLSWCHTLSFFLIPQANLYGAAAAAGAPAYNAMDAINVDKANAMFFDRHLPQLLGSFLRAQ